jgi:hypothetical protein
MKQEQARVASKSPGPVRKQCAEIFTASEFLREEARRTVVIY